MMTLPMQAQLLVTLQSVLLGAGLALVYDALRAVRLYFSFGRGKTALCDALFWLVLLAALFTFSVALAAAHSRYYVLAGMAAGAGVYFTLLSGAVLALLHGVFRLCGRIFRTAAVTIEWLHSLLQRVAGSKKITGFAKKFAKPSSIFRRKGLK